VSASGQAEAKATWIGEAVSINRKVDDRRRTTIVMHVAIDVNNDVNSDVHYNTTVTPGRRSQSGGYT
jgi:ribosome-associated protein YbcJ (S4-like RNA binding protein)